MIDLEQKKVENHRCKRTIDRGR